MKNKTISEIQKMASRAQFASFDYTTDEKKNKAGKVVDGGETARYNLILGATYLKTIEKSIVALSCLDLEKLAIEREIALPDMILAGAEVLASLNKSFEFQSKGEQNPDYTKRGLYIPCGGGLNINSNDNTLQIFGMLQSKVVLQAGIHKHVNSAPLTIHKGIIRKLLPIGKFREFKLENISVMRLNGETIEIETGANIQEIRFDYVIPKSIIPTMPEYETSLIAKLAGN